MSDIGPVDEQSAGLCRVLEPIVATFRIDDPAAAARLGVQTILPAVITLRALREAPALGPWHGLLHRRCRICPAGDGAESPVSETASETVIDTRTRAGWRLVRARTAVGAGRAGERWPDGAVVVHDLARRLDDGDSASPRAPGPLPAVQNAPDSPDSPGSTGAPELPGHPVRPAPADARARVPGEPTGSRGAKGFSNGRAVLVSALDIAAWSRVGGDCNRLHLIPGAARTAGLRAGRDDVIAHGLLLAAVSLALIPAEGAAVDLRMRAPLPVPVNAGSHRARPLDARVLVEESTGALIAGGRCVLQRD